MLPGWPRCQRRGDLGGCLRGQRELALNTSCVVNDVAAMLARAIAGDLRARPLVALRTKPSAAGSGFGREAARMRAWSATNPSPRAEARVVPIVVPNAAQCTPTRPNGFPLRAAFCAPSAVPIRLPVCLPCRRSSVRLRQPFQASVEPPGERRRPHRRAPTPPTSMPPHDRVLGAVLGIAKPRKLN